jgi:predicted NBD/HSP70 family sugar kinase
VTPVRERAAAGSPSVMRRMNSALILDLIRRQGPLSRADIARASGLSKPTVNEVVELLLDGPYVVEDGGDGHRAPDRPRRPGPRARLLCFRADVAHVLGIDVGAAKLVVDVADLSGRVAASERRAVSGRAHSGHAALLREVREAARAALERAGVAAGDVLAAGVGTPGVVAPATGRITLAPQLEGWEGLDLGGELERDIGCPVAVDNETNLSLLAEADQGVARGVADVLYVQVGVGIGAALLVGGELHRGAHGAAGEIGYLPGDEDADAPQFGAGPFEWAAGGRAYARLGARAAAGPGGEALLELAAGDPERVRAETVFAAAARGGRAANDLVARLAARLGRGIATVATVLDPDLVVLGGGLANAGPALRDPVERAVRAHTPVPPRIELSTLGDESVAIGAVRLALNAADARLFAFDAA